MTKLLSRSWLTYLGKAICVFVCLDYRQYHLNTDILVFCDSSWIWIWEVQKWWSLLEVSKKKNSRPSSKRCLCMHQWHNALSSALRIDNNVNFVIPAQANSVEVNSFISPFNCLTWLTYNFSLRLIYLTRSRTQITFMIGRSETEFKNIIDQNKKHDSLKCFYKMLIFAKLKR